MRPCNYIRAIICALYVAAGADKFDVVWLHNHKEIKPSKDFEYANQGNVYTLKIAEIFPEDSGTYTCEAFNDAGESFSSCSIVVLGKYKCIYSNASVSDTLNGVKKRARGIPPLPLPPCTWIADRAPGRLIGIHVRHTASPNLYIPCNVIFYPNFK